MAAYLALAAILLAGCVATTRPAPDVCPPWVKVIIVDMGFETRLTVEEKRQILLHDENVERFCQ